MNPTPRSLFLPHSVLLHLLLLPFLLGCCQFAHAQPAPPPATIEAIHARSQQHNYPDQRRTDSDANRQHLLQVLLDAALYEGEAGSLVDAIAAEPHYQNPSLAARRTSAGDVARCLRSHFETISADRPIDKQGVSLCIAAWKSEMEGYENAVRARRVAPHMGEAVRFSLWLTRQ